MPHAPQLVRSTLRSRQTPLHSVRLPAHESAQVPPLQISPAPQVTPQPPQLRRSVLRSRHAPLQLVLPLPQVTTHDPDEHT